MNEKLGKLQFIQSKFGQSSRRPERRHIHHTIQTPVRPSLTKQQIPNSQPPKKFSSRSSLTTKIMPPSSSHLTTSLPFPSISPSPSSSSASSLTVLTLPRTRESLGLLPLMADSHFRQLVAEHGSDVEPHRAPVLSGDGGAQHAVRRQ